MHCKTENGSMQVPCKTENGPMRVQVGAVTQAPDGTAAKQAAAAAAKGTGVTSLWVVGLYRA